MTGSVRDLVDALNRVRNGDLADVESPMHRAADALVAASSVLRAVWNASQRPEVASALRNLQAAMTRLGAANGAIEQGDDHYAAYIADITGTDGQRGDLGASHRRTDTNTQDHRDSAPASTQVTGGRLPFHEVRKTHPSAVQNIRRHGWPRNADGKVAARGDLYIADGHRVNRVPYRAHRKGEQPHRPELAQGFNDPVRTSTAWHAEADVAQAIRNLQKTHGIREFALYINIPLCGSRPGAPGELDPRGCSANFPRIIPDDVVVYIHVVSERGQVRRSRVQGTGEGIT